MILLISMFGLGRSAMADEGNERIDYQGFQELVEKVDAVRQKQRVDEEAFLRMAAEEGTVILDTRSKEKFDARHVKGALHLNFSDFSEKSLAELIPDKSTRILIYCNNNFVGDPYAMFGKLAPLALNIPTFIHLYGYGYERVYELEPDLPLVSTRIPFEGKMVLPGQAGEILIKE
ncbi:rhodanese-related sulfurtransferase [Haloferula luteola]|uniref:Rhodanese-related sulfurtransferase n=1 Tax=Haloferula luteola TaxID=595692 RepID=A0A840VIG0_9BACT|nr:rhodanese-like domain-containing protein [Haloferula luteola]MBB5352491.1 rhodanese-related sulfurtransferase [Haloferula luteola]